MCSCQRCVRNKSWVEKDVPEEVIELILNLELDNDYYKAVLNGNWPSGKEVLENAIKHYEHKKD